MVRTAKASERASSLNWSYREGGEQISSIVSSYVHNFLLCQVNCLEYFLPPQVYSPCTYLMLDTSQSYLPLRRGSSDDEFEESPPLDKQQRSPPRWRNIFLIISGVTNIASLCLLLSYLFLSLPPAVDCPATSKCSAATTEHLQTSYSKQNLPRRGMAIILMLDTTSGNPYIS